MHAVFLVGQQQRQRPEGVFLVHVHEQEGSDLTHALAVAHLLQSQGERDIRTFLLLQSFSGLFLGLVQNQLLLQNQTSMVLVFQGDSGT